MENKKELAKQITALKSCGEILISISKSLKEILLSEKTDVKNSDSKDGIEQKDDKKTWSFEEVRGVLAAKSRDGHTSEIKDIISSFNVEKLSDINPSQYDELMKKVEVI